MHGSGHQGACTQGRQQEQWSTESTLLRNETKCVELSWKCIPLAVESYAAWDPGALRAFSQVATRPAILGNTSKCYGLLSPQSQANQN